MMNTGWFSRSSNQQPSSARIQRIAWSFGVAVLLLTMGVAAAQNPAAPVPAPGAAMSIPNGYSVHSSVDAGGRITNTFGSASMYDTLVNLQSGPRLLGQTFEMRALAGNKHPLFDNLSAFSSGYGGEPYDFSKLNVSKGKYYEFSGLFRRDRQYFDYDLLGNPGIPSGYSIPISGSSTPYAWPQINDSPFMFNTVRRMTDTNLTLLPLSKVTFRFAYSKNIFQGPSLTPSGNSVAGSEVLLEEFQRNSTDDFTGAVDWKPIAGTRLTYEQEVDHYKGDSYFTMDPAYLTVQESDGTKVALLANYQNYYPYGYSSSTGAFTPSGVCNSTSMIGTHTNILYANPAGGLPIIDPACNVISSYIRTQPIREIFPTEIFRLQSSSIKNIAMNGDVRYTSANMNMPNYYEDFQGLDAQKTSIAYTGNANAKREVIAIDYGVVWQATKTVSLSDQVSYSNVHQPGTAEFTSGTTVTVPTTAGAETINNVTGQTSTTLTSANGCTTSVAGKVTCTTPFGGGPAIGTAPFAGPMPNFFGQKFVTNNATVSWDATSRATFALTYRHRVHDIAQYAYAYATQTSTTVSTPATWTPTIVDISENGGIFNVALRPANNWELNGSVETIYADNVFTPVAPRETQHYRVHTMYRPKPWATISAAYNDLERHNNTNNTGTVSTTPAGAPIELGHEDHSRVFSLGADLMPNEHYGLDLNYSYSDVYTATNICFLGTATVMPGSTVVPGSATPLTVGTSAPLCYTITPPSHGSAVAIFGPAKDFEDAPTQYGSAAVILSPNPKFKSNLGYRVSAVNGTRFFTDALDVNGSLVSTYQTPFANVAWTIHPGLIWKGEYDYYGYGEGGRSGAQWCSQVASPVVGATSEPVEACSSVSNTAMYSATPVYGFTAPRNFHANNVVLGVHYEF